MRSIDGLGSDKKAIEGAVWERVSICPLFFDSYIWGTVFIFGLKLPAHPVRTGQARRGFPASCNIIHIVPLNPAYPAPGGTGHVPANNKIRYKLFYWSRHFCPMSRADPLFHRHPVIGVYKFYENWSTETFRGAQISGKWNVCYTYHSTKVGHYRVGDYRLKASIRTPVIVPNSSQTKQRVLSLYPESPSLF